MEFHAVPIHRGDPPIPLPLTPYVSVERYDGGPWMSYPQRKGKSSKIFTGTAFDYLEYSRAERVNPTPVQEHESFFQTWLYFGLIAEFIGANQVEDSNDGRSNEALNHLYDNILVKDGQETFVKLDRGTLDTLLELGRSSVPPDVEARKTRYLHLVSCLKYAQPIVTSTIKDFNSAIHWSLATLGELLTQTATAVLELLSSPVFHGLSWTSGLLNEEAKASMKEHGWCPSDIARVQSKYYAIQTLYVARMLDRSLPPRDHSSCTDLACGLYQIRPEYYQLQHQTEDCPCAPLTVDEKILTVILSADDKFPLLKLKGDLHDLSEEIVECDHRPYVAISHVWADGLGNPDANSLHKCKLHHLQALVDSLDRVDPDPVSQETGGPLIWLDTLCCPAKDLVGKKAAIEKIRLVYQRAKHVLVLDAGLMSYPAEGQDFPELFTRIFTSSWTRRLWTLQEGALAKSLYFQFSDQAISLHAIANAAISLRSSLTYRAMVNDFVGEYMGLSSFFITPKRPPRAQMLYHLDRALQWRSVSVASDEPLCIGTLMSLDLHSILSFTDREDRMVRVWQMISERYGGIPSQIIFFEEPTLSIQGWRWAPKGLLTSESGLYALNTRMTRWADPSLAQPTPEGLRVKFSGWALALKSHYNDKKPKNPWPGMPRVPESWLQFRQIGTGGWFRIADNKLAVLSKRWKADEDRQAHNELGLFPLHKIVEMGKPVLIKHQNTSVREAILATVTDDNAVLDSMDDVPLRMKRHVIIQDLGEESYIYDVIEQLALQLREDPLTDKHLELCERFNGGSELNEKALETLARENEEFKASIKRLRDTMKVMFAEKVQEDEKLVEMVKMFWGPSFLTDLWVLIQDFFRHDLVGEEVKERKWVVD